MGSFAFEKHYRIRELAGLWGLSSKTVTRMFAEEAGVIRVANEGSGKRKYATLSIPESVALRVHERLGNQPFQATLAGCHPLRIIRLGDLHAGVPKKSRNIIKLKPSQQLAHGECVT
jgi:AraC-like DNA-binding protein